MNEDIKTLSEKQKKLRDDINSSKDLMKKQNMQNVRI